MQHVNVFLSLHFKQTHKAACSKDDEASGVDFVKLFHLVVDVQ